MSTIAKTKDNKPAKTQKQSGGSAPQLRFCCLNGHHTFIHKIFLTLAGVLLVYLIFLVGTAISLNIKKYNYVGKADRNERTISVTGLGKVTGDNNIAVTTIGYSNIDKEVAKAQADNTKVMDQVSAELKKIGIEDKDMQSNYTIYPEYNYSQDEGTTLRGYRVTNSLTVKIRDLTKINSVLSLAGKFGANEVGGLTFTIDDPSNLKDQAREKSLKNAQEKAMVLADLLGVKLGGVVTYNEYESADESFYKYGIGGAGGGAPAAISGGSKEIVVNTNVIYEILPKK